ncbi:delta-1-pyrroline-5-carboxylate dehydrogenase, putative [Synechococcus sp. PCC 7335]|uniref:L-glutamate gamma-semialdehyde dehydrogenase n=1 Tax=Synechococcus sp. (strain ATCC 29403 / PCC 7335) TaxID=91464 RepID=UPI00017ECB43|nr:L-glutamate gamma-semialdehyde dehydrogenase [Synechococcus sp. PCC 7335]EDX84528.1 delta-1-pyrroline-5-carboxylate dehydrogenase, putative [Synechococcus sp. PCC 7335]
MVINASRAVTESSAQADYEEKTQAIARQLLSDSRGKGSLFSSVVTKMRDQLRWDDKLLAWTMENPGLRVQMFRLIDCLPALTTKAEIASHFQEYLGDASVELPQALKSLLNFADPNSMPAQVAATTLSGAVETLARKYIAGENIKQALKSIEQLRKQSMAFTMDLLGEAVVTEREAEAYLNQYLELMAQLTEAAESWKPVAKLDAAEGKPLAKVQVSVKLTAFYSQFDPLDVEGSKAKVGERVRTLLRRAEALGVAVHFDMEQYRYKDATLAALKQLLMEEEFRSRSDIGMTLQAYLRDSYRDLEDLIGWAKSRGTPITLRLVKGAYWDQETITARQNYWPTPVYNHKSSTDANFERMTRLLLENHQYLYAAIGSHNVRSQALAMAITQTLDIPARNVEFQVLYGMADSLANALVKQGHRVRVYCPYGELIPGMAYLIRRLLENTANSSFLRQNLEERPAEELLAIPQWGPGDADSDADSTSGLTPIALSDSPVTRINPAADTDYAVAQKRSAADAALEAIQKQIGKTYRPLIDGEYVQTSETVQSVNPSRPAQLVGTVGQIDIEQANSAIASAKTAFETWKRTPVKERAAIINRAADLLEERRHELNAWMVLEGGKPLQQADAEVSEAADFCRYYAAEMERLDQEIDYDVAGERDRYFYRPKGIVLVISPWNFPLAIPTGMTVAALVTGNCALLKPAAVTSVIAAKLSEIFVDAGIPKGVFQYVPGRGSTVGSHMVKHPDVHMIVFTGSQEVGCQIYADAAILQPGQKHLKRVVAEMGGKNAIIVDESADLDQAVQGVVYSAFGYSGQKCSACSRVIVVASIYETFVARVIEATKSLNVGDAVLPSTKVGPVIDAAAQQQIRDYIEKGKSEATLALELPSPEPGYFVGPVIFTDVDPQSTIAQEEIFGPVLAVIKADSFEAGLAIANNTNYALTGGLYSRTPSHIERAYADFEVGNLYINRTITGAIVARQPFGGFKLSGVGSKAGGPDYLLQFLDPRTVTENVQRQGFAPIEGMD